mmetsp:Transcript_13557/g.33302  ORF Transcript_13557/g.33302 Transcript_13557/m.33302 type:complete len:291 (+) Transcript_13557:535-1407(+)
MQEAAVLLRRPGVLQTPGTLGSTPPERPLRCTARPYCSRTPLLRPHHRLLRLHFRRRDLLAQRFLDVAVLLAAQVGGYQYLRPDSLLLRDRLRSFPPESQVLVHRPGDGLCSHEHYFAHPPRQHNRALPPEAFAIPPLRFSARPVPCYSLPDGPGPRRAPRTALRPFFSRSVPSPRQALCSTARPASCSRPPETSLSSSSPSASRWLGRAWRRGPRSSFASSDRRPRIEPGALQIACGRRRNPLHSTAGWRASVLFAAASSGRGGAGRRRKGDLWQRWRTGPGAVASWRT